MSEMSDDEPASARNEPATNSAPFPSAMGSERDAVFLAAPRSTTPLADTAIYRPGALVALIFLVPPTVSALAMAIAIWVMGSAPVWLPLLLLLWLPMLLAGWLALRGVRLTRDQIAVGRPLGPWRVIPLDTITRLETRGWKVTLVTATGRVSFHPALLGQGAQLRRRLLLSLPLSALSSDARAEAAFLLEIGFPESDEEEALSVHPPLRTPGLAALVALAFGAGGVAVVMESGPRWLAITLGVAALVALVALCWLAQQLVINERGVSARLFGRWVTGSVTWQDLIAIHRTPGELALLLRGKRVLLCPGPGLLNARDARRVRQIISFYIRERGMMTALRPRR